MSARINFQDVISNGGSLIAGKLALSCRGLTAFHDGVPLLRDFDLDLRTGEIVAIVIESEWGARYIPRMMNGIEVPEAGTIELFGTDITGLNERLRLALRHQVGYLFHNSGLIHNLTVWYNVALPALYHSRFSDLQGVSAWVDRLIARCGLERCRDLRPALLDEATRKRVALARAWVMAPPLLIFEDPLMDIDVGSGGELLDLAFGPSASGDDQDDPRPNSPAVLLTSQGLHEGLFRHVDRLIIVENADVIFADDPRKFDRRGKVFPRDVIESRGNELG